MRTYNILLNKHIHNIRINTFIYHKALVNINTDKNKRH